MFGKVIAIISLTGALLVGTAEAQDTGKSTIVRGASTTATLIQPWIQEFEKTNPSERVVITASTHGIGFDALLNGEAEICMTARKLNEQELSKAAQKGAKLSENKLLNDAVAIIVNTSNTLEQLSVDQLAKIFAGQIKNWKDVGGDDQPIQVLVLPETSGMSSFLKDVFKTAFDPSATVINTPRDVPVHVRNKSGAIGFCRTDLANMSGVKPVSVCPPGDAKGVPLKVETIQNGSYPIIRPLGLCYDESKASQSARKFVDFCRKKAKEAEQSL